MLSFESDYIEGAHPRILERLAETNFEKASGYGNDPYCQSAREKIRAACQCPTADVEFLVGGTQTNAVVIDTLLHATQGVISAQTGHVAGHEAGAIEYTGHKVLTLPQHQGKLDASEVEAYLKTFYADPTYPHMVQPGMVYISHPTEYGTLYTADELKALSAVCRKYRMPLYMDGARLGYGLMSRQTDVDLPLIAELCDAFYIGGTKVGALCGEAVVFPKGEPKFFFTSVKQHGALLAKRRLLGIQFDTLFTDGLYFELGRHAIDLAEQLKEIFLKKGYRFHMESPTNQQFPILPKAKIRELERQVTFSFWEPYDESHDVVRFATGWATRAEDVQKLEELL